MKRSRTILLATGLLCLLACGEAIAGMVFTQAEVSGSLGFNILPTTDYDDVMQGTRSVSIQDGSSYAYGDSAASSTAFAETNAFANRWMRLQAATVNDIGLTILGGYGPAASANTAWGDTI